MLIFTFVVGFPQPEVRWCKNRQELQSGVDIKISYDGTVASLAICDVLPEDSGTYCCIAENLSGKQRTTSTVTVCGKCQTRNTCI